jgi:DnaJ like chaperone protein
MIKYILSILALLYALMPYDALPDFIVGWGWIDDLVILYFLWRYFYKGRGWPFQSQQKDGQTENRTFSNQGRASSGFYQDGNTADEDRQQRPKNPYEILGVPANATQEEIKSAYKRLAAKYHPDKVLHLGDEFRILAEKRFKEIQDAYQSVKRDG